MKNARHLVAALPLPRRRAARRADRALGRGFAGRARSSTTTGRPKPAGRSSPRARRRGHAAQVRLPVVPRVRLRREAAARGDRARRSAPNEKGVLCIVPPLPPGCMTHRLGRRRALRPDLFHVVPGRDRLHDLRLGDARRGRLLLRARPHRRRDQRRRPPARHARDRGSGAGASERRRSRRGRRGRSGQGPGAGRLRGGEGSGAGRHRRGRAADASRSAGHGRSASSARSRGRRACTSSRCCRRRARASCCARSIQALAEGRDPGDLTTIEDPAALEQIRSALTP